MLNKSLFTSHTDEWATPQDLFDALNAVFKFALDPCATRQNAKCRRYFTRTEDGLKEPWTSRVFMNPPYGRSIGKWVKKAYEESRENAELVVCLLPSRTDTAWWHDYCMRGEVWFIRGRLKFGNSRNSAPFPSVVVCFQRPAKHFQKHNLIKLKRPFIVNSPTISSAVLLRSLWDTQYLQILQKR